MELWDIGRLELADGTVKLEPAFLAQIDWDGELRVIDVLLTSSEEALIGTRLLGGKSLNIDFRAEEVIIA